MEMSGKFHASWERAPYPEQEAGWAPDWSGRRGKQKSLYPCWVLNPSHPQLAAVSEQKKLEVKNWKLKGKSKILPMARM